MESEQRVDFAGLLRAMSLPAADALVDSLRRNSHRGLEDVRLACRALRDLVDGSVLELWLSIGEGDLESAAVAGPLAARQPDLHQS
ncbi:hypothetical protein TSOC_009251 [Tetrabaena socialis]|uniref:Uncharacterized protein n=1 Tax=Tetrabaena socialis TaxID=47790 RepID=A0A2J7ZWG6_9CHLO|nr:hypothetical protein TSOC_009251 [Tetrabaena socialis]|eukprot:PNH04598.1 hypothetical protein TSOC_009251 [Tetrabaena socialis]